MRSKVYKQKWGKVKHFTPNEGACSNWERLSDGAALFPVSGHAQVSINKYIV
jgi:hypothetical protein